MSRESFLSNVRQAARLGRAFRVTKGEVGPLDVGPAMPMAELRERFLQEVNDVGGAGQLAENWSQASMLVDELLSTYAPRRALAWQHELLDRLEIPALFAARSVELLQHSQLAQLDPLERRARIMSVDVGITSADVCIAETGTLVVCAAPGRERIASLIAPVHIAVVAASQLVANIFQAFARVEARFGAQLPSNITLITGPSKTGDIELTLTTGVHGPGKWHVILVDDAAAPLA